MAAPTCAATGTALAGGTRASSPVPVPSGVVSGSVLLVHLYIETASAVTPPAGFTEISFSPSPFTTGTVTGQRVFWKRASGADSGTYTFTHASTWTSGAATRYAGVVTTGTPTEVLASGQRSSNGTVTPTLSGTTAGADRLLVYGATVSNSSEWTPPTGFTEVFDPPGDEAEVAVKAQAAAGSTGPVTASSTSSAFQTVTLIALVPASTTSDTTPPSVPSGLVATATGPSTISLTWTASTDDIAVTGYTVKRGGTTIASGITGTGYGDSGLSASTLYSYTVSAQDAAGNSSADSSSASATTGVAAAPSLTVTPTVESDNLPPRIRLNVSDTRTTKATEVTVVRLHPDGSTVPVRTPDGGPLTLTVSGGANTGLLYDYEAPYSLAVSYATVEAPGSVSFEVIVDSATAWLVHPGVPELSQPITVQSVEARTRKVQRGVFYPMGRRYPVVQTDGQRKAAEYNLTLLTWTDDDRLLLGALLDDAGVLYLNVPAWKGWGIDSEYVAVGDMSEARPARYIGDPLRTWSALLSVVDRPVGGTQAQRTLTDLLAYPTLQSLGDHYPTLLDVLNGP